MELGLLVTLTVQADRSCCYHCCQSARLSDAWLLELQKWLSPKLTGQVHDLRSSGEGLASYPTASAEAYKLPKPGSPSPPPPPSFTLAFWVLFSTLAGATAHGVRGFPAISSLAADVSSCL